MTTVNRSNTNRQPLFIVIAVLIIAALASFYFLRSKNARPGINGTYRIYSDDPAMIPFIQGQDTYIKIVDDKTVIYNSTINNKPKFHYEGSFTYDPANSALDIKWESGKLPAKLIIENKSDEQVIRIGETIYKKDKGK